MSATGCCANYRGYNEIRRAGHITIKGNRRKNLLPFLVRKIF